MKKIESFLSIILVLLFLWPFLGNAAEHDSVQLFTNGSIYIDEEKKVDNLLVVNGVVKAINVSAEQHKDASIIDLNGSAAYPGFIDSHVHLMETGYFFYVGSEPDRLQRFEFYGKGPGG